MNDFIKNWIDNRRSKSKDADRISRELGVYDADDFETIRDEVSHEFKTNCINEAIRKDRSIRDSHTPKDMGIRATNEVYQSFDDGTNQEDINKAINKVGRNADKRTHKASKARDIISAYLSKGFYGYLSLRKMCGYTLEHPTLKPWYANELYKIPALINPGGRVTLTEGNFKISANNSPVLLSTSNVALVGKGKGTQISLTAGSLYSNLIEASNVSGLLIADMFLDGTSSAADQLNCTNQDGICFKTGVDDSMIRNVWITGNVRTGIIIDNGSDRNITTNCNIYDNLMHGICTFGDTSPCIDNVIANNYLKGHISSIAIGRDVDGNVAIGNIVKDVTSGWGIACTYPHEYCIISGNYVHGSSADGGIRAYDCTHNIVAGNTVGGTDDEGLKLQHNAHHNLVENNVSIESSQGTTNTHDALLVTDNCDYNLIQGNVLRAGGLASKPRYGINISGTTCNGNLVINNDIYDDGFATGVLADTGTATIIRDNRGYNPVGGSTIPVTGSPFTYTSGASPETVYIRAGTVSLIVIGGRTLFVDTGHSIDLPPLTSVVVTYSGAPTMEKYVH